MKTLYTLTTDDGSLTLKKRERHPGGFLLRMESGGFLGESATLELSPDLLAEIVDGLSKHAPEEEPEPVAK